MVDHESVTVDLGGITGSKITIPKDKADGPVVQALRNIAAIYAIHRIVVNGEGVFVWYGHRPEGECFEHYDFDGNSVREYWYDGEGDWNQFEDFLAGKQLPYEDEEDDED